MKTIWPYGEKEPSFDQAGAFDAWIADSHSAIHSAAAWRVVSRDNIEIEAVEEVRSSLGPSTAQRGALAALVGVFETLQSGSSVEVHTNNEYVQHVRQRLQEWKSRGWRGSKGPLGNIDILKRIDKVLAERRIAWSVHLVSIERRPHGATIERLRKLAHIACQDAA